MVKLRFRRGSPRTRRSKAKGENQIQGGELKCVNQILLKKSLSVGEVLCIRERFRTKLKEEEEVTWKSCEGVLVVISNH